MDWVRMLAYITGTVDQELVLRNEYLVAENRILSAQMTGRPKFSDADRITLAEIGYRLGRKALEDIANAAKPDTVLGWYRELVAQKFDGSKARRGPGRPRVDRDIEALVVRIAKENPAWSYHRFVGALANLGYSVSDQSVGNILKRHGIPSAPERKHTTTWNEFIRSHLDVLSATDFFTVEVLTLRGLVTYYVLFFIHLETRKVEVAGITVHPSDPWMRQIARNVTMEGWGFLEGCRYLIHDRDTKFTDAFQNLVRWGDVKPVELPARSPSLNAYAERWVRSVEDDCLSRLILFGEASLRRALREYLIHYQRERNHQGKGNVLLFPTPEASGFDRDARVRCKERLGGLLKYYDRAEAA